MSNTPKIPDLPDPGSTLESLTRFAQAVRELLQVREGRRGPALEEGVTFRDLVDLGIVVSRAGGGWATGDLIGSPGPAGPAGPAGPPGTPYVPDYTAPPTPTGLAITTLTRGAYIEWDAPGYTQGHGNAYTRVLIAQRASMSDPAPVFADAVEAGRAGSAGTIYVHQAATGAIIHAWITFVTNDGVESAVPAGGANGVSVTIGKIDGATEILAASIGNALIANLAVDNAKIANMSASKLTAGTLAIGEEIVSTNYVAGVAGWRIAGSGAAQIPALYILGQLVASQIDTRNLTIKDGAGNVIFSAGTPLTQTYADSTLRNDYVPVGINLIYNSAFEARLDGWTLYPDASNPNAHVFGVNLSSDWRLAPAGWAWTSVAYIYQDTGFTGDPNHYYGQGSYPIPVKQSQRYVLSAYLNAHRCDCAVFVRGYRSDNTLILAMDGAGFASMGNTTNTPNAKTLDQYTRVQSAFTTASDCAYVIVFIRKYTTHSGAPHPSSYMFVTRLMLEEASGSAGASVWSDSARQHAITAANISTYIAAAAIGDAYIANLHAGKITAGLLSVDRIESEGITKVSFNSGAGPYSDTDGIAPVTVTPYTTCKIVVTATGTMFCSNSTGSTRLRKANFGIMFNGSVYGVCSVTGNISNGDSTQNPCMSIYVFEGVPGGSPVTFSVRHSNHAIASIDQQVADVFLRVEVIYR